MHPQSSAYKLLLHRYRLLLQRIRASCRAAGRELMVCVRKPADSPAAEPPGRLLVEWLQPRLMLSVTASGTETLVNTTTAGSQYMPNVTMDRAGASVIVWTSSGTGTSIDGRQYSASGTASGSPFQVNVSAVGTDPHPSVAMDTAGGFVVCWDSGSSVYVRLYNSAGTALTGETQVATDKVGLSGSCVAMTQGGSFLVVWEGDDTTDSDGIYAREFTAAGLACGGAFLVNTTRGGVQTDPAVAVDQSGDYVVAWTDESAGSKVKAVYLPATGTASSEILVGGSGTDTEDQASVGFDGSGNFIVTWAQDAPTFGIYSRRYEPGAMPIDASPILVSSWNQGEQLAPSVAERLDGAYLISWTDTGSRDGSGDGVFAQAYTAAGTTDGAGFQVNTTTSGSQQDSDVVWAGGTADVVWDGNGAGDSSGIFLQHYTTSQPTDQAPVNTVPTAQYSTENNPLAFSAANGNAISVIDADAYGGTEQVTLTVNAGTLAISSLSGITFVSGSASGGGGMSIDGTIASLDAALASLVFTPAKNNLTTATLQIVSDDLGNTFSGSPLSTTSSVSIHISAPANPSSNVIPGAQTTPNNVSLVFMPVNGNSINVGSGIDAVELSVSHGKLTLATTSGLTFQSGNGTAVATMSFSGTQAAINAALNGLIYAPTAGYTGSDTLTIITTNSGLLGLGLFGSSTTSTVALTVTAAAAAANQAPSTTVPGTQTTDQNATLVFNGNTISVSDVDADGNAERVTLAATSGTISLHGAGGLTFISGTGTKDASETFTGTLASINAALNGLSFIPAPNFVGSGGIYISIDDLGYTGTGGALTNSASVAVTIFNGPPTVSKPASATPNQVTATTTALSVLGADDGGASNLTYTWATTGTPPAPVTFSDNSDNTAQNTVATFTAAGTYNFQVTIADVQGASTTSAVAVTVKQTFTSISIAPTSAAINQSAQQQFTATDLDQFGAAMASTPPPPTVNWTVTGAGTISNAGLYTAPAFAETALVTATSGPTSATAAIQVGSAGDFNQPTGGETLVNAASTGGTQQLPAVAMAPGGNFVVVWEDGAGGGEVNAQLYSASGSPIGAQFQVNTAGAGGTPDPSVAMNASGAFVVCWNSGGPSVYVQQFNAAGVAQGANTLVTSHRQGNSGSDVALAADGSFTVVYEGNQASDNDGIYAQRFSAAGVASGLPVLVNTTTQGPQTNPSIAADPEGGYVVAWTDQSSGSKVKAAFLPASGPASTEFLVGTSGSDSEDQSSVGVDGSGNFVIAWAETGPTQGIYARRYNAAGTALDATPVLMSNPDTAPQTKPAVSVNAAGSFLVAWTAGGNQDGNGNGVFALALNADGSINGGEFQVNTTTQGNQQDAAVAWQGTNAVIAWDGNGVGDANGVFFQTYTQAPAITAPAAASPDPVTGATTALSVMAGDTAGTSDLTYTWSTTGTPPAAVSFSANGTNAARNTTATFTEAGIYDFQVTVADPSGYTATSAVSVQVEQTLTRVAVSPAAPQLLIGEAQQFTATAYDQFGNAMAIQPAFSWSATSGVITPSGNYTAPATPATATISAVGGGFSASATVPVTSPVIDFSNGFTGAASKLTFNGSAVVNGTNLELTDGGVGEAGSAFSTTAVDVSSFRTAFEFQTTAGATTGDGFTFTIQTDGPTALGLSGGGLGYGADGFAGHPTSPVIGQSICIKFDLANNAGEGNDSTGLFEDGANPIEPGAIDLTPSGVNLHSGDVFRVVLAYDGTTLNVTIYDTQTGASASQSYTVDIPGVIGATNGYVGFTGGTGGLTSTQDIQNWIFSPDTAVPNTAPTVATAALASPASVNAVSTNLSALGASDAGESNLLYIWQTTGSPAAPVNFSANGTNAAQNTTATFTQAGAYSFQVAMTDADGLSATNTVNVTVNQTLTSIVVAPATAALNENGQQQFAATAFDQFGDAMATQPTFTWTLPSGTGSVTQAGLYTAIGAPGSATVRATSGAVAGTAAVTVTNAPPTVATPAAASPSPGTGTTASLSVLGADDGGESNLTYLWATTGTPPASVSFSANNSNAAKNTTATFTKSGSYSFKVTIKDSSGLTTTSSVSLTVNQTLTSITLSPVSASMHENGTQQFAATGYDQFGSAMASQPTFTWSVTSGPGSASQSGIYTASAPAGVATVTASSGSVVGTASVTVTNAAPTVATPAAASPSTVTGTTTALSVLGTDDGGESNLTYTWATTGTPPAPVTFSANGTNAAKNTTATFAKSGSYTLKVTITDSGGLTTSSTVPVVVDQTFTSIKVSPGSAALNENGTQQFSASALDQFGAAMSSQPSFTWTLLSGPGSVSASGRYTASTTTGSATVCAASGSFTGDASLTVTNAPPTVATPAAASPTPVTGTTTSLSVLGADDGGEASLTYTWATAGTPPAPVAFSVNGTNAAQNTTATFTASGDYNFVVTITDAGGLSTTGSVSVTVNQTLREIIVLPSIASIAVGTTQQCTAVGYDQFGSALATQPTFTWSVSGGGSINQSGLYTAPAVAGDYPDVKVTSGSCVGLAQLMTVASPAQVVPPGDNTGTNVSDDVSGYSTSYIYTWAVVSKPANAPDPTFSVNATTAAYQTVVTFYQAGSYLYVLNFGNANGSGTRYCASFEATVEQTPTSITLTPGSTALNENQTQQFSASATDQFGNAISPAPAFTWTVTSGAGSVSAAGLYTATSSPGTATVEASSGSAGATATVTVTNAPPTVATPASASPSPVTGTTTTLSVLGADDGGEANLTYTWATTGTPPASVNFSVNGDNAAKNTVAAFTKLGTYNFKVTITDTGGLTATSSVTVTVSQAATSIVVTPATAVLHENATQQFSAVAYDQFGAALATQPAFLWSKSGVGSVNGSGLFTAPGSGFTGTTTVTARDGAVSGSASVSVTNAAPTIATPASASPSPVTGTTTSLSVLGADDGGETNLTYAWSTTGTPPAPVNFSDNADNTAKNTVATFRAAGTYDFKVTITDALGASVTSAVSVTVNPTLREIIVLPSLVSVPEGTTQQCTAVACDQFGSALATQPAFTWAVSGGGTINQSGLFTAPPTSGSSPTVTASSGSCIGLTSLLVVASPADVVPPYVVTATNTPVWVHGYSSSYIYTWSVVTVPTGAAQPTFSVNATTSADNTTATFYQAGSYLLVCNFGNANGSGTCYTATVSLTVEQTATTINVQPTSASVSQNGTQQFTASADDQFGDVMSPQPTFTWSIASGAGSINSSGLYSANLTPGSVTVAASAGSASGSARVTVPDTTPTVATPAAASPNPVSGTTASLSVLGADDAGESNLTYTWATTGMPPAPVTFGANGTNAAKNTTAIFAKAGAYSFQVTITNSDGLFITSGVTVTVNQTFVSIALSPGSPTLNENGQQQFTATALDQFGAAMASQPTFTWTLPSGTGSVTQGGLYTATGSPGSATVRAASGSVAGTASVTVTNAPPTVATPAAASPSPVTGTTTALSVLGADDGGESNLTYTWATFGTLPAPVNFSANGTNAAKNTIATFAMAGTYHFRVTITDAGGLSTTSSVRVTVAQTLSSIQVSPGPGAMADNTTYPFSATAWDQFGDQLATQPAFTWSVDGGGAGGTINSAGLYSTPASNTGTDTIRASSGSISATASVSVTTDGIFSSGYDVGPSYLPGSFSYNAGTYTVTGGYGAMTTDNLQYANATFTGDTALVARVTNTDVTGTPAQAGVMFRDSTSGSSAFAAVLMIPGVGVGFYVRTADGDADTVTAVGGVGTPQWVEVVRSGNKFSGYYSADGIAWTQIGSSVRYTAPSSILGGLMVSSLDASVLSTATFDDVYAGAPTIATPAAALPDPVTGTSTNVSVLGAYPGGESSLTYTWSTTGTPPAAVTFADNGTNSAKDTTATFTEAGNYDLLVTVSTGQLSVTSSVPVTVSQTLTSIAVSPRTAALNENATRQFTATAYDQFGAPLATQPPFSWSSSGVGSISGSGLYTAPGSGFTGTATVTATSGPASNSASVDVTNARPTVAGPASASPGTVTGTTARLSVLGADDGGESNLTYSWATTGTPPAPVSFSDNDDNSAKNTTATFTEAGPYDFLVTITDAGGLTVTSAVNVTVEQTLKSISLSPSTQTLDPGYQQQFIATGYDQFGQALSPQPAFTWSVPSGAGTVDSSGLYTAPATTGSATVAAASGSIVGLAAVSTDGPPVITAPESQIATQGTALRLSSGMGTAIAVNDPDANGAIEQISLTASEGTITLPQSTGLTFSSGDPTSGVSSMTFTGTLADMNADLDGLTFTPMAGYLGPASVTVVANDLGNAGLGGPLTATRTVDLTVEPPAGIITAPTTALITDDGGTTANFTVALTRPPTADVTIGLQSSDPAAGMPTVDSLTFTPADWDVAQEVTVAGFDDSATPPTQIAYRITTLPAQSADPSYAGLTAPEVQLTDYKLPPVVQASAGAAQYAAGSAPVVVDGGISVQGPPVDVTGATVTFTSGYVGGQDNLSYTPMDGISATWNESSGQLVLSGTAPAADYQDVLQSISYLNTSQDAQLGMRSIEFAVTNDGGTASATRPLQVTASDAPPVIVAPASQQTNSSLVFSPTNQNGIVLSDAVIGDSTIEVSLTARKGSLSLASAAGLTFTIGSSSGGMALQFQGTLLAVNDALRGLTFTPFNGYSGPASVLIAVNDLGNNPSGAARSASASVAIAVQAPAPLPTPPPAAPTPPVLSVSPGPVQLTLNLPSGSSASGSSGTPSALNGPSGPSGLDRSGGGAEGGNGAAPPAASEPPAKPTPDAIATPKTANPPAEQQPTRPPPPPANSIVRPLPAVSENHAIMFGPGVQAPDAALPTVVVPAEDKKIFSPQSPMWEKLDKLSESLVEENRARIVAGSATFISVGASVVYLAWFLRAGSLISSLVSSMPAWSFVDPLPILDQMGPMDESEDDESLQSIVERGRRQSQGEDT